MEGRQSRKYKFKKLYIYALACFILINIGGLIFVFRQCNSDAKQASELGQTKLKLAKIKDKIHQIKDSLYVKHDTMGVAKLRPLELSTCSLDSMLVTDQMPANELATIQDKIYQLSLQSNMMSVQVFGDSNLSD